MIFFFFLFFFIKWPPWVMLPPGTSCSSQRPTLSSFCQSGSRFSLAFTDRRHTRCGPLCGTGNAGRGQRNRNNVSYYSALRAKIEKTRKNKSQRSIDPTNATHWREGQIQAERRQDGGERSDLLDWWPVAFTKGWSDIYEVHKFIIRVVHVSRAIDGYR